MIDPTEYDPDLSPEENVARGLFAIAAAIRFGAKELGKEGAPGMGAIEFLATKVDGVGDQIGSLASAVSGVAEQLEGLSSVAEAITAAADELGSIGATFRQSAATPTPDPSPKPPRPGA